MPHFLHLEKDDEGEEKRGRTKENGLKGVKV